MYSVRYHGWTCTWFFEVLILHGSVYAAFLDQLQTLQQSLSTISGVLGFAEHPENLPPKPLANGSPALPSLSETNWRANGLFITENEAFDSDAGQQPSITAATGDDKISSPEMGVPNNSHNHSGPPSPRTSHILQNDPHSRSGSRSLFKWKSDSDAFPKEPPKDVTNIRLFSLHHGCSGFVQSSHKCSSLLCSVSGFTENTYVVICRFSESWFAYSVC